MGWSYILHSAKYQSTVEFESPPVYAGTHTSGHEVVVAKLLAAPKIAVYAADHEGLTSLRIAVRHRYERAVGRLLAHPGINVNMSNYGRETSWDMVVTQVHCHRRDPRKHGR